MNEHRIREIVREELAKARSEDAEALARSLSLRQPHLSEKSLEDEIRNMWSGTRDANGSIPVKWPNPERKASGGEKDE